MTDRKRDNEGSGALHCYPACVPKKIFANCSRLSDFLFDNQACADILGTYPAGKNETQTGEKKMFYLVSVNNTWTNEPSTIETAVAKGFEVVPSRRVGDFQMFRNGIMCGWMFSSQAEQIAFLRSKGLI